MSVQRNALPPAPLPAPPVRLEPPRRVRSQDLLAGSREIEIIHGSQCYRLRLTALGKLILTK